MLGVRRPECRFSNDEGKEGRPHEGNRGGEMENPNQDQQISQAGPPMVDIALSAADAKCEIAFDLVGVGGRDLPFNLVHAWLQCGH